MVTSSGQSVLWTLLSLLPKLTLPPARVFPGNSLQAWESLQRKNCPEPRKAVGALPLPLGLLRSQVEGESLLGAHSLDKTAT